MKRKPSKPNVLEGMAQYMAIQKAKQEWAERCQSCGKQKPRHVPFPTLGVWMCP